MPLLSVQNRARQQRALQTLDSILTEDGGVRLQPLRWVVEPNASLTGHVPPRATEGEIRELFDIWTDLVQARRLPEFDEADRTQLRSVLPNFGYYRVHVTISATIPDVLVAQERELQTVG